MFLKRDKRPNGRIYLSIVRGFRDPVTKKNKQRAVKSIGFLDEFEDIYDDPIEHFKNLAKGMTEEENLANAPLEFSFDRLESVKDNEILRKNFGFAINGVPSLIFLDAIVNNVTLLQQKPGQELFPVKRQIPHHP